MKQKLPLIIAVVLLLAVGAFCAFLIYDAYESEEIPTGETVDIASQIKNNEETAFAFLGKSENILPDDMHGYIVDPSADMSFEDTSEDALKKTAENVFSKVNAILPDTVVVRFSGKMNYSHGGFDVLSYFVEKFLANFGNLAEKPLDKFSDLCYYVVATQLNNQNHTAHFYLGKNARSIFAV